MQRATTIERIRQTGLTVVLFLLLMATACQDDDPKPDELADIYAGVQTGAWQITYFFDEQDETAQFDSYIFVFNDDKTVVATRDAKAVAGTWEVVAGSTHPKLVLDFAIIEPFDELNDDWEIQEYTESKMILQDVSGGNAEIDYLTFEKQ